MMRRNGKRGFTFAEILVALIFMAIVLPIAVQSILTANRAGNMAQHKRTAALLADTLLAELLLTEDWVDTTQSGDFGQDWLGYRWELEAETWDQYDEEEQIYRLTLRVFFTVQGLEHSVALSTLARETQEEEEETTTEETSTASGQQS